MHPTHSIKMYKSILLISSILAVPQFKQAAQFVPASVGAVNLAQANQVDVIASKNPNAAKALLDAADEGLFPDGVTNLLPVTPKQFCANVIGQAGIAQTVGAQFKTGGVACSSSIGGITPARENMVSTLITFPIPGQDLDASKDNLFTVNIKNLVTGFFSNANAMYYLSPQTTNSGKVQGHQHVVAQQMNGNNVLNPRQFVFFKGINQAATDNKGQVLTANIPAGTFTVNGLYRFCSITGADTHQPILSPVLQRGPQDDCVRVNVVNAQGGLSTQAKGVAASAQAALKKTQLVEDQTGILGPAAGKAALQKLATQ
jgi:hypothetical protein